MDFAQKHIRILSGLYGILRPLDLIQEYRLEMGIKLKVGRKNDLYEYWRELVTQNLNKYLEASGSNILVNLASDEYFSVLDLKKLKADILKIQFREYKEERLQFISFNTKRPEELWHSISSKTGLKTLKVLKALILKAIISKKRCQMTRNSGL